MGSYWFISAQSCALLSRRNRSRKNSSSMSCIALSDMSFETSYIVRILHLTHRWLFKCCNQIGLPKSELVKDLTVQSIGTEFLHLTKIFIPVIKKLCLYVFYDNCSYEVSHLLNLFAPFCHLAWSGSDWYLVSANKGKNFFGF